MFSECLSVFISIQSYFRCHEGDGAQELALELSGPRALGGQPRCCAEVSYP